MNKKWLLMYEKAKQEYEKNGKLNFNLKNRNEEEKKLLFWLHRQRKAYKNRTIPVKKRTNNVKPLNDNQVELLENIGMVWSGKAESYSRMWYGVYLELKKYHEEHGTIDIVNTYITENGHDLSTWLKTQRKAYENRTIPLEMRKNKLLPLTDEQVELLNDLGMIWDRKDLEYSNSWIKAYNEAKEYFEKTGNLDIPKSYTSKRGINLANWLDSQRKSYRSRTTEENERYMIPLTDLQVKMLENIGMIWNLREYHFVKRELTKYKKRVLEKRFLEFLSNYIKENKNEIESYDDVLNIVNNFTNTLGSKENHYNKKR